MAVKAEDIVCFYLHNSIVMAIDKEGVKYIYDKTLAALENKLNHSFFFRANRKYLINIDFVKSFKSYERVKLAVKLLLGIEDFIIISQEKAPFFKKWIYEEVWM